MIKRARVTEIYQINLYCDKCGKRMERDEQFVLFSDPPKFQYKCECGHTETSTKVFPTQQVYFDEENAEEIEEWGVAE